MREAFTRQPELGEGLSLAMDPLNRISVKKGKPMKIGGGWPGAYYRKVNAIVFSLCLMMGSWQKYNEFVLVCQLPLESSQGF
jgi:hypothetical protein